MSEDTAATSSSPTKMRVVGREVAHQFRGAVWWLLVEGQGEWPTECGCGDAVNYHTEVSDERLDYGWLRRRCWVHTRDDGKRRLCVLIGLRRSRQSDEYLPLTPAQYDEYQAAHFEEVANAK